MNRRRHTLPDWAFYPSMTILVVWLLLFGTDAYIWLLDVAGFPEIAADLKSEKP